MQVSGMHNCRRYTLVVASSPCILFDVMPAAHLAESLECIDEVRPARSSDYLFAA